MLLCREQLHCSVLMVELTSVFILTRRKRDKMSTFRHTISARKCAEPETKTIENFVNFLHLCQHLGEHMYAGTMHGTRDVYIYIWYFCTILAYCHQGSVVRKCRELLMKSLLIILLFFISPFSFLFFFLFCCLLVLKWSSVVPCCIFHFCFIFFKVSGQQAIVEPKQLNAIFTVPDIIFYSRSVSSLLHF